MAEAQRLRAAIIVISETASKDSSTDKCIPALQGVFADEGNGRFEADDTAIITDDLLQIQRAVTQRTDGDDFANLIVTSGGTGFTQKDVTPEVRFSLSFSLSSCFTKKIPSSSALLVLKKSLQRVTES